MRRVVVLRRGKSVWHIDVSGSESDEEAKERALEHANGVKKANSTRWLMPPSNGKPGWEFVEIVEQFPHEAEAALEAELLRKLTHPEIAAEIEATRARLAELEAML